MKNQWYVKETPCFPNSFKVVNDYYKENNSTSEYFPSRELAQVEADQRNEKEYSSLLASHLTNYLLDGGSFVEYNLQEIITKWLNQNKLKIGKVSIHIE